MGRPERCIWVEAFLSGSFDHLLDDEERLAALRNTGRHLAPGGCLAFDVFLGLMGDSPLSPAGVARAGGREIRRFVGGQVLPEQRKETWLVFEVYQDGALIERIEERSLVGITSRRAIHRLLKLAGFVVRQEWSSYGWKPFEEPYYENRTGPAGLLASYYNAVNCREYARAWAYWENPSSPSYEDFVQGFADTAFVRLALRPPTWFDGAGGSTYTRVLALLRATHVDGSRYSFVGCFVARRPNVGGPGVEREWSLYEARKALPIPSLWC